MLLLNDLYNRYFSYIRLSITDLCNFNCQYCLPYGIKNLKKNEFLSTYEIYNLISAFSDLGINKIRITGGEPTVRKDFLNICKVISSFKNIKSIVFTTNGYKLSEIITDVYRFGFNGINISFDALNYTKFLNITNRNYFSKVYNGILKSLDLNFDIKLNIVLSDFFSISDFEVFYSLLKYKKLSIRFISQMETNIVKKKNKAFVVNYLLNFLKENNWYLRKKFNSDGPALNFENNNYIGNIGIINPYSKSFCLDCNRLRISSTGYLFLCLFGNKGYYIKNLLSSSQKKDKLKEFLINKIKFKMSSHFLKYNNFGMLKTFSSIGG